MSPSVVQHLHIAFFTIFVLILVKFTLVHLAGGKYSHYNENL